jgi:ribosome assembly protein YihI (activator of Der GTPase)
MMIEIKSYSTLRVCATQHACPITSSLMHPVTLPDQSERKKSSRECKLERRERSKKKKKRMSSSSDGSRFFCYNTNSTYI